MIQLTVNGESKQLDGPLLLIAFLKQIEVDPDLVVVERNREIVPKASFEKTSLADGDVLEIVRFMGGG